MDPRKTLVIADFDRVVRAVQEAGGLQPSAAGATESSPSPRAPAENVRSSVIVGRTVVAGAESRSLAKTQVWRSAQTLDRTIETDDAGERERAEVTVDTAVMHHLSAEVWAGQVQHSSHLRVTTVKPSLLDVTGELIAVRESEAKTEVLARVIREYSEIRIPRMFRMPSAKAIRVMCLGLCMASAAAIAIWPPAMGRSAASVGWKSDAPGGGPVAVESTWRTATPSAQPEAVSDVASGSEPSPPSAADRPAGRSNDFVQPSAAGGVANPAAELEAASSRPRTPVASRGKAAPAPAGSVAPRGAVDALIAGQQDLALSRYRALAKSHPSDPVYATAAQILEDAMKRGDEAP